MKNNWSSFILKIIAIITMTVDHIGAMMWMVAPDTNSTLYNVGYWFRVVGRLALPLYIFLLVEGLYHTRNKWKYLERIFFVWAIIAVVEAAGTIYFQDANYMPPQAFTELLLYVLIACLWTEKQWWKKALSILPILYIFLSFAAELLSYTSFQGLRWFPSFLWSDYDIYGLALFIGFYFGYPLTDFIIKKRTGANEHSFESLKGSEAYHRMVNATDASILISVNVVFWILAYIFGQSTASYFYQFHIQTYATLSAIPILFYSGQLGYNKKWFKWFNYLYYPVHLVLIFAIFALIFFM